MPTLKVKHPSDFIAVVPYLLGFHPTESVVCLLLSGGRHQLAMRSDLPGPDSAAAFAANLVALAERHGSEQVLLLGYSSELDPVRALLEAVAERLAPVELLDALVVDGRRWWSLTCHRACCPADGTPYDMSTHPLTAAAVYAGMRVGADDRSQLRARLDGPPAEDVARLRALAEEVADDVYATGVPRRMTEMRRLVNRYLERPWQLDDTEAVRFAVLAIDLIVRDVAWSMMRREQADLHAGLWEQVVARTASPLQSAPLCLVGMAGWIGGNGALLNCAIERMEEIGTAYSMLDLLRDLSERAVPPDLWASIAGPMTSELRSLAG